MKCPTCGETIKNGRCPFCGFRPTQEDLAAEARWAAEKKKLSGGAAGADWRAERPAIADLAAKAKAGIARNRQKDRPAPRAAAAPSRTAKQKRPRPANPTRAQKAAGAKKGMSLSLLLKIAVILWILFVAFSFCQVLAGEYGIDLPGLATKLFRWIGHKLSGEPEYIVPQGNYILYG